MGKCAAQVGCNYFAIGTQEKLNRCYWEHDVACSDPAQNVDDSYDVWVKSSYPDIPIDDEDEDDRNALDRGTEAWPPGFCLSNGNDQNSGVTKLDEGNYEGNTKEAQCLAQCKEHAADWTGCEVIWDQGNAGCYVHTEHVNYANNVDKHKCLLREVYDAAVPTTAEQTGCALNECRPGGSYTGTYSFTNYIGSPSGCTTTYCDHYLPGGDFHSRCTAAAGTDARGFADAECLGTCQGLCTQ